MDSARIKSNGPDNGLIVYAKEVLDGVYDKNGDFIDGEEEFRVTFVSASKNHGKPYFRLYYSWDEYNKLSEEKKTRYNYLQEKRHFQDSKWHKEWEEKVKSFCKIEYYYWNPVDSKSKRADAAMVDKKTIIEFQHSFEYGDFHERNAFYNILDIKPIWLFDVTKRSVTKEGDYYIILEDNSIGFFKVSYQEDLGKCFVYIQDKERKIYRIKQLYRKEIEKENKSTIRYFYTDEVYTEEEFISFLENRAYLRKLDEIWNSEYKAMFAYNHDKKQYMKFYNDNKGNITRVFNTGCIGFQYASKGLDNKYYQNSDKFYSLSEKDANEPVWEICWAFYNN